MISIRQARPADAETILAFQMAMAEEVEDVRLDPKTVAAGVRAVLDDPTRGRYWLAEVDGQVAGGLLVTPEWSDWRNGTVLWLQSVYVRPAFRRRGVFRRLFEHVRGLIARDDALKGLRLYVDRRNALARQIYADLGLDGEHYQTYEWMKARS